MGFLADEPLFKRVEPEFEGPCRHPLCKGKYEQYHRKNDCCSCHVSPPCGYCTDPRIICSACGDLIDETC